MPKTCDVSICQNIGIPASRSQRTERTKSTYHTILLIQLRSIYNFYIPPSEARHRLPFSELYPGDTSPEQGNFHVSTLKMSGVTCRTPLPQREGTSAKLLPPSRTNTISPSVRSDVIINLKPLKISGKRPKTLKPTFLSTPPLPPSHGRSTLIIQAPCLNDARPGPYISWLAATEDTYISSP
jgi:hypothetical protein